MSRSALWLPCSKIKVRPKRGREERGEREGVEREVRERGEEKVGEGERDIHGDPRARPSQATRDTCLAHLLPPCLLPKKQK